MILSIDPGIRGCGAALFRDHDRLAWAAYVPNPVDRGDELAAIVAMGYAIWNWAGPFGFGIHGDTLAVEFPQVYQGSKQKGDPRDLLALAAVDGAIASRFPGVKAVRYFPREWKGQVDPDVMISRISTHLEPAEIAQIAPCRLSLQHNIFDAIGIGLFNLGRLGNGPRVISRGGDWKPAIAPGTVIPSGCTPDACPGSFAKCGASPMAQGLCPRKL